MVFFVMPSVKIPGVFVVVYDVGVLLRGPAGSGKSLTALNLLKKGHKLVSDDVVELRLNPGGELVGKSIEEKVRIEVRGLGVFEVESIFPSSTSPSWPAHVALDLDSFDPGRDLGKIALEIEKFSVLGREIPLVRLPLANGADPGLMVEIIVRYLKATGMVIGA
jgi:HPr kinase/phosphorylase